jgi:hypothetical protein
MNKGEETFSTLAGTLRPAGGTRAPASQSIIGINLAIDVKSDM